MRISACAAGLLRRFSVFFLALGIVFFVGSNYHSNAYAQTVSTTPQSPSELTKFRTPDVEGDVPRNSHTYTQIVTIDVLSAVLCQLTGIDPVNPKQACVSVDPTTGKFVLAPAPKDENGNPKIGGLLGVMSQQMAMVYQPPVTATTYFNYLSSNFGLEKAYAQNPGQTTNCNTIGNNTFGYGYCGLNPIFNTWKTVRDIAYAFLVVAFVILALGIMLRFKADPRTVMTLQNQIPRVIVAILLITFSYAIAGFMIDLMWTITYMGIGAITNSATADSSNPNAFKTCNAQGKQAPLGEAAPQYLLQTPLSFTGSIFATSCDGPINGNGILKLGNDTGGAIGDIVTSLILKFVGIDYDNARDSCGFTDLMNCVYAAFGYLISFIVKLIVVIALLVTLIRLWFQLLKTAVIFMVYTIAGPIWIVFGLIPGRPLGFEKWLRQEFAHLAAFPLVAWALVGARVLADIYPLHPDPNSIWVPPLIGNPNMNGFGALLAFGLILITPGIPDLIKEKMKVPGGGKLGSQIRGGIASGAGPIANSSGAVTKRLTRKYDPETQREAGILRQFTYGRILGMKNQDVHKKDAHGNPVPFKPTRRYKLARMLMGGSLGVGQDTKGHR